MLAKARNENTALADTTRRRFRPQEAPGEALKHSSTPALQHSSNPALQHSSTPALQHSSTPALQHSSTPPLQHSSTPALHPSPPPPPPPPAPAMKPTLRQAVLGAVSILTLALGAARLQAAQP